MSEEANKPKPDETAPEAAPAAAATAEAKPAEKKPAEKKPEAKNPADEKKPGEAKTEAKTSEGNEGEKPAEEGEGDGRPKAPTAADLLSADIGEVKIRRAKGSKNVHAGIVHVLASFNNTKVTFTDKQGNVISWSSSGKCNFRGSRKSTAYAAQIVTQDAGRAAMSHGMREVEVRVSGPGMGRDSAVRALQALGLNVTSITDVTPVPHNGCRAPKRRRV